MAMTDVVSSCANLLDLPADLSVEYLKEKCDVSLKSRQQGFRLFNEGYFIDVKLFWASDRSTINVSAKCYRSQRKNEKPHSVHLDVSPKEVSDIHCSCQAGMCGSCSHVVGLVIALQQWQLMGFSDVPAHLSCTSLPQHWGKPRGEKIDPAPVTNIHFINPKPVRKRKHVQNTLQDCRLLQVETEDIQHLQSLKGCPISYLVSSPPSDTNKFINTHIGAFSVGSGLSTHAHFFKPKSETPVNTNCGNLQFPRDLTIHVSEEIVKTAPSMQLQQCVSIEERTRDQSNSRLWFEERKHRLTASEFGSIVKRRVVSDKFIDSIINPKFFTSAPTSYGKNNEKKAIKLYIERSGNHVHDCGLIVNPKLTFLGGTPDGKICDQDGTVGLLEVKCPFKERDLKIVDACLHNDFCLENKDGVIQLKTNHNYFYQIQGQLLVSGSNFVDFVVYTKKDLFIQRIQPDNVFMLNMVNTLFDFYESHVKAKLKQVNYQYMATALSTSTALST